MSTPLANFKVGALTLRLPILLRLPFASRAAAAVVRHLVAVPWR